MREEPYIDSWNFFSWKSLLPSALSASAMVSDGRIDVGLVREGREERLPVAVDRWHGNFLERSLRGRLPLAGAGKAAVQAPAHCEGNELRPEAEKRDRRRVPRTTAALAPPSSTRYIEYRTATRMQSATAVSSHRHGRWSTV